MRNMILLAAGIIATSGLAASTAGPAAAAEHTGDAEHPGSAPFLWGASSAAFQVEGATSAEGRGKSIWDVYLDDEHLGQNNASGRTAINFYDRRQYLKDIELFRRMGLTSYRFSVAWPRIIPDGTGKVNMRAVAHYRRFIDDLRAAGIEPMLTLYHWDMPESLAKAGGWDNRESIDWYAHYAKVVFDNFHDKVNLYVLVNEPLVESAYTNTVAERLAGRPGPFLLVPDADHLQVSLRRFNHILLAAAAAKGEFNQAGYHGRLGVALPLFPILTDKGATRADAQAATLADGIVNRWFLDGLYKGAYPADVLKLASDMKLDIDVHPGDAAQVTAAGLDFLGINYYAPLFVRQRAGTQGYGAESFIPPLTDAAFNGPVRPDQFTAVLDRIRIEYANPAVYITENGAGFPGDDVLKNGVINDVRRCRYIVDHVAAMQKAMAKGADVRGYHVWSSHDNLEWLSGYGSRFGMIYVDFDSQARISKESAKTYARIIQAGSPTGMSCPED
ncbi:glycoside hydrolase family 1 protein [Xanthomonas arboricola pv. juglandis]|uniref:glycoside hydrolase family 1 protein n=1 Tax=Xanthomonas TaxID=338 RepID=UPI000E969423|nr:MULTISPECIES: family 1 glycosylhydrolase [Xanthomonas]SYZ51392.1 glycoside hydrolase family 1 protein [Xanthomonas arboricola pv. juglandis]